ncbi:MAG TPA: hypothetical protein VH988_03680 [Thermoanaerobaculia bacterium]|jgi:hypothetical protein|nr:hypothetical protein [Thermoanaerobaculia bacterium]
MPATPAKRCIGERNDHRSSLDYEVFDASKFLVSIPLGKRVTSELDKRILLLNLFGDRNEVIAWSAAVLVEIEIGLE